MGAMPAEARLRVCGSAVSALTFETNALSPSSIIYALYGQVKQNTANVGDIVVALYDGGLNNLKKLHD